MKLTLSSRINSYMHYILVHLLCIQEILSFRRMKQPPLRSERLESLQCEVTSIFLDDPGI